MVGLASELAVEVVLADEDEGQIVERRHVDRLVEGAFVGGAVAEEADRYPAIVAVLGGEGRAEGDGGTGADDAVGAEDAQVRIGDVHGAALGEEVTVAPVGGGDVVGVGKGGADADRHGLLAHVEVDGPAMRASAMSVPARSSNSRISTIRS